MNYTTLTINGEKIGLKFGMASFRYLSEGRFKEGKSFANNQLTEIGIAHIIYSGYMNNCIVKEIDEIYNFEFFVDYLENNISNQKFLDDVKSVIDIWSMNDFIKSEEIKPAKKKTLTGKK